MTNDEIIKQLESLLSHCKSMIEKDGGFPIWEKDCEALGAAIAALRPKGEPLTLEQLVEADKGGRCVVLPFRPPKTVYSCSKRFPIPEKAHYVSAINILWDMDRGYVKEVTPQFSVMDIYSDKKAEVNQAITEYLNEKLSEEYGINVTSALIIDVELDTGLQEKIKAKEQAKQDVEIAELQKQTALAKAEIDKAEAQAAAEVAVINANADAEVVKIQAEAEAEANRVIADSITQQLIDMKEADARLEHGWVTVQGANTVVANP